MGTLPDLRDGPLEVRFVRWHTASPDGRRLAFEAVGKIWIMDLPNGTPRRLTGEGFEPLEFAPNVVARWTLACLHELG